jgi:hypothetical protein
MNNIYAIQSRVIAAVMSHYIKRLKAALTNIGKHLIYPATRVITGGDILI